MSEHTPGPWYVTPIYMPYDDEDTYEGEPVCWRVTDGGPWREDGDFILDIQVDTCEADAKLIATAPNMLKVLSNLDKYFSSPGEDDWGLFRREVLEPAREVLEEIRYE